MFDPVQNFMTLPDPPMTPHIEPNFSIKFGNVFCETIVNNYELT